MQESMQTTSTSSKQSLRSIRPNQWSSGTPINNQGLLQQIPETCAEGTRKVGAERSRAVLSWSCAWKLVTGLLFPYGVTISEIPAGDDCKDLAGQREANLHKRISSTTSLNLSDQATVKLEGRPLSAATKRPASLAACAASCDTGSSGVLSEQ